MIRILFKTFLSVVLILLILGIGIIGLSVWLSPYIIPKLLDNYVECKTGFKMVTKNFSISPWKGTIRLADVTIYNPPEYTESVFLKGKEFFVKAKVASLLREDTLRFNEVIIDIDNLTWVRNARNDVNLIEFVNKARIKQNGSTEETTETPTKPERKFFIQRLVVRLGSVSLVGFPDKSSPLQTFQVNYNREFNNVQDLNAISKEIGLDMAGIGIRVFAQGILQTDAMQQFIKNLGQNVTDKVKDILENTSEKTGKQLKSWQQKLNSKVKKLFD